MLCHMLCNLALKLCRSSDFKGFVTSVETFEEFRRIGIACLYTSSVIVVIDSMISDNFGRWHKVFVEVTCLGIVPLGIGEHLIANFDFVVNVCEILKVGVGSEVISHENFCLFWSGSVGAG